MGEQKPKLVFVGNSHARRLFLFANNNDYFKENFTLLNFTKPGGNFTQLPSLPDPKTLTSRDTMVFWCFGNKLMKRPVLPKSKRWPMHWFMDYKGKLVYSKVIHLEHFEPLSQEVILKEYEAAKEYFQKLSCKIVLLDNPIRHTKCCATHGAVNARKGLFSYQLQQNKNMLAFFQNIDNVTGFRHINLLKLTGERYSKVFYEKLLPDSVHFSSELYGNIMLSLQTRVPLAGQPPTRGNQSTV